MLKVVLVDDEKSGIRMLERRLSDYPAVQIDGAYTNPLEALKAVEKKKPQVIFLDIDMPELQGLDAAEMIKEKCPETHIVFVTGYDDFAVDAFELEALDYLLKPVSKKRFATTFDRILTKLKRSPAAQENVESNSGKLEIHTMGKFEIVWSGKPLVKWRSKKTRELAAFLILKQGKRVSKELLIETLWPDHDLNTATNQLYKNIHYIRKSLEESGVDQTLIQLEGKYSLKIAPEVRQDSLIFSSSVASIDGNARFEALESVEKLYLGDFLEGEEGIWLYPERNRLLGLYNSVVVKLAEKHTEQNQYEKAEEILIKAFNDNPCEECLTLTLLKIYAATHQQSKAAKHFNVYKETLNKELGIAPPESILNITTN
ncbi:response regulator [Marinifilum sp. JC120]|nr:response regulator [Marinifilum sp. JC120]